MKRMKDPRFDPGPIVHRHRSLLPGRVAFMALKKGRRRGWTSSSQVRFSGFALSDRKRPNAARPSCSVYQESR